MGSLCLVDVTTYVAGYDMTTDMNQLTFGADAEKLDNTTFGSGGWRTRVAGLKDVSGELKGYWQAGAVSIDNDAFANLGTADRSVTVTPTGVGGDVAYLWRGESLKYSMFDDIGKLTPFTLAMVGSNGAGLSRGKLVKPKGSVAATGVTGSSVQLPGGVAAGLALHASFHVFGAGTTITALVESDNSNAFPSPVTVATFGPITAVGGTTLRVAGPLTDDWYRLRVSAITGSFSIACAIGIGV